MGHLVNKNELLVKLRERLDRNPIGLPEDINVYEILSILFTNEEAHLASKFPLDPATLEDLQVVTNIPPGQLKELLSAMLKKGLVLETKKRGQSRFMLSMALVGFFEFIFMRTNQNVVNIDIERCLGCGACVNFCEQNAIQMLKRKERIIPPSNMSELMTRLKQDRGK